MAGKPQVRYYTYMITLAAFPFELPQAVAVIAPDDAFELLASEVLTRYHPADRWRAENLSKPFLVGEAKEVHRFASQTAVGKSKVVILPDASLWSAETANSLLKLLEEPPAYLDVLVLATSDQLLPTVRSRLACLYLPQASATLDTAAGDLSDRERWQKFLEASPQKTANQRKFVKDSLYIQSLMHSGHRTDAVLAALAEVRSTNL